MAVNLAAVAKEKCIKYFDMSKRQNMLKLSKSLNLDITGMCLNCTLLQSKLYYIV